MLLVLEIDPPICWPRARHSAMRAGAAALTKLVAFIMGMKCPSTACKQVQKKETGRKRCQLLMNDSPRAGGGFGRNFFSAPSFLA